MVKLKKKSFGNNLEYCIRNKHANTNIQYFYKEVTIPSSSINLLLKQRFKDIERLKQKDISTTQTIIVSLIHFYYVFILYYLIEKCIISF